MHKCLLITAAAVFAAGTNAYAGTAAFVFGTAHGAPYCDGGTVTTAIGGNKAVRAWLHVPRGGKKSSWGGTCDNVGTGEGLGLLGKVKGIGAVSEMSDTLGYELYTNFSEQLGYVLPKNIKDGQPWSLWIGMNGTTSFEANSGVLVSAEGKEKEAIAAAVKRLISKSARN